MEALHVVEQVRVRVAVAGVEQGAREHRQAVAQAGRGGRVAGVRQRPWMQGQENAAQARVFPHQQDLHPAILEELHGHALEGAPVVGDLSGAIAAVADHVGEYGAVAVDAGNLHPDPLADPPREGEGGAQFLPHQGGGQEGDGCYPIVEHVGHAQPELVVVRHRLAQFVEGGGVGHQQVAVAPQCAQVKLELPLDVDEQGAVAFALQDRQAVGGFEAEIVLLALRVAGVIADPVIGPVLQAGGGQQAQDARCLIEEMRQAGTGKGDVVAVDRSRGAPHQVQGDIDVDLDLLGRLQAACDAGQGLQEGRDGLAVG